MNNKQDKEPIVSTIQEQCKTCYTCIRECPAKAISIINRQAEVIEERCIHCGNCVKVCTQNAKKVKSDLGKIFKLIASTDTVAAIVAPSFPAEFSEIEHTQLVGVLRDLGFDLVVEVGFGADLVAREYRKILLGQKPGSYIASTCPAVVSYVEKYVPELVPKLAKIVSPMVATARVLRKKHGKDLKIVFIGPCIAKKSEIERDDLDQEINDAITFGELRYLLNSNKIDISQASKSNFDPPEAAVGALFSLSAGLLQAADIREDYIEENVITANGKVNFLEAIKEFKTGYLSTKILETLCCEGCILGPGISNDLPLYKKRHLVSKYVRHKMKSFDKEEWQKAIEEYSDLDLSCNFKVDNQLIDLPSEELITQALKQLGKFQITDELNCGACGYETCREHAIAILRGFAENEMCLPYTIEKLRNTIFDLEKSYAELKSVRETLDHREKLASMGQLSAGIAHELNNPLGVILMYSNIILEDAESEGELKEDLSVIANHANRCKKIVSGLLNFSRQNKLIKTDVDIIELSQHCLDSVYVPKNINIKLEPERRPIIAEIDKDQISQVIINLINNSVDAMEETGGNISIIIGENKSYSYLIIKDDGPGIPEKFKKQIFDPFFTTKQLGKGTGLGLSVSYGIVKMHTGAIEINSNSDKNVGPTGTSVKVSLPKTGTK